MSWQGRPFVRLLLFFLLGIFIAYDIPQLRQLPLTFYLILDLAFLLLSLTFTLYLKSYRYRWLNGLSFFSALVITGMGLTVFHSQGPTPLLQNKSEIRTGEIINEPQFTNKSVKLILKLTQNNHSPNNGNPLKIMAYIEKDSVALKLHLGDFIVLKGKLQTPKKPLNPEEFDYKNYLKDQGIKYTLFVAKNSWEKLPPQPSFNLKTLFATWRNYLLGTLRKNGLKGNEYAVAAAILLGYDELMAPNVQHNYVAAGVIHILCVSGMHVGIIYVAMSFLLSFLLRFRYGNILKNMLLLTLIWGYALLTGLSPSVSRAAVMISFFVLANALQREYDSYNLLATSAFFLLVFNPFLIFNVGFQLSYAAVLGIITFYFPIYKSLHVKYKLTNILWAAIAVSFSAQLAAFPIATHYFHVFPVYFLITNLLVFVLAYFILSTGMALLMFSWFSGVAKFLGIFLTGLIYSLNRVVSFMAHLPFSQIQDLFLPWGKVWLLYALIILLYFLLVQKKIRMLLPVLSVILLLLSLQTFRNYRLLLQEKLVIYAIKRHTALDFIHGKGHLLLIDSIATNSPEILNYHIENYRIKSGLKKNFGSLSMPISDNVVFYEQGFVHFGHLKLLIIDPKIRHYPHLQKKIDVDLLIYRGTRLISLQEIMKSVRFRRIVFDASVRLRIKNILKKESEMLNLKYFTLSESGAMVIK